MTTIVVWKLLHQQLFDNGTLCSSQDVEVIDTGKTTSAFLDSDSFEHIPEELINISLLDLAADTNCKLLVIVIELELIVSHSSAPH